MPHCRVLWRSLTCNQSSEKSVLKLPCKLYSNVFRPEIQWFHQDREEAVTISQNYIRQDSVTNNSYFMIIRRAEVSVYI